MKKIDFNKPRFNFSENEDILVDTGVLLALFNKYDLWHKTIKDLFNNHIYNSDKAPILYTHSGLVNEFTHKMTYEDNVNKLVTRIGISKNQAQQECEDALNDLKDFIQDEVLQILDSNVKTLLRQIDYSKYFGAMDSLSVSITEEYGISLLVVDNKLVNNLMNNSADFKNIKNIYFTTPKHMS